MKKKDLQQKEKVKFKIKNRKQMKYIYIATLRPRDAKEPELPEGMPQGLIPEQKFEKVVISENIAEIEAIVEKDFIMERVVMIDTWFLVDGIEEAKGDFYMADTAYFDEVKQSVEQMQFFVRAESFMDIEDIISNECGETFRHIKAIEKSPYEVLGI